RHCSPLLRPLPSFPTRRSSDLNPDLRIAMASYETRIATRWGRTVRDDIAQNPGLGLEVRHDMSSQSEWELSGHMGGMFSVGVGGDRKSTRLNSSHVSISYAVFC